MNFSNRTPRPMPEVEPPITTPEAANALIDEVTAALGDLETVIGEETRRIRSGLLFAAAELEPEKSRAMAVYLRLRTRVKTQSVALGRLCNDRVRALRARHEAFAVLLRENLTVLAIAREVSEDLVRSVSEAAGKHTAPRTYGRDAGYAAGRLPGARGLAIDRRL